MRRTIETIAGTILVPGVFLVGIPYLILSRAGTGWPARIGILQVVSVFGVLIGMYMVVWVSYAFVKRGNGTPIPLDPPSRFVASGLFRYVRNPMYVGAILVLISEATYFTSIWLMVYAFLLWLAFHIFLVVFEEPQLGRRFGESYRTYKASTPRWLPRMPARERHSS